MRDEDIRAIVAYLRTQDRPATYSAYKRTAYLKPNPPGSDIYFSQCASCHGADGRGEKGIVPALDGNGMVLAAGPHNVINVIIGGVEAHGTFGVMPALGTGMTDQQVADVSNFVRQAWSNNAPPNATAYQVAVNRREADGASGSLLNGERTGGCPALDLPKLQAVLADGSDGVMHQLETMTLPTMLQTVDSITKTVRQQAPDLTIAQITNGLTTAYCPVVFADPTVAPGKKSWQLGNFSTRVFTQLRTNGTY
ncbi:MAG: cytochrome c, partial [Gluconacetobacter diazotrophicus]|nr:cytochrome c [Gluconacetobacter diazotrophicus]